MKKSTKITITFTISIAVGLAVAYVVGFFLTALKGDPLIAYGLPPRNMVDKILFFVPFALGLIPGFYSGFFVFERLEQWALREK